MKPKKYEHTMELLVHDVAKRHAFALKYGSRMASPKGPSPSMRPRSMMTVNTMIRSAFIWASSSTAISTGPAFRKVARERARSMLQ